MVKEREKQKKIQQSCYFYVYFTNNMANYQNKEQIPANIEIIVGLVQVVDKTRFLWIIWLLSVTKEKDDI